MKKDYFSSTPEKNISNLEKRTASRRTKNNIVLEEKVDLHDESSPGIFKMPKTERAHKIKPKDNLNNNFFADNQQVPDYKRMKKVC